MLEMMMQPYMVALHDEPQRFCVVFQPYDNPAVSFPAHDGSDGSVDAPSRKDEAGDVAAVSQASLPLVVLPRPRIFTSWTISATASMSTAYVMI